MPEKTMMMKYVATLFIFCLIVYRHVDAQEKRDPADYHLIPQTNLLIISSTKSYNDAVKIATGCSEKFNIKYLTRGSLFDTLSRKMVFPKDTIKAHTCGFGEEYCYRGLKGWCSSESDDGIYITIEEASHYGGLTEGLYIVVVGNGSIEYLNSWLIKIKHIYPNSYVKKVNLPY